MAKQVVTLEEIKNQPHLWQKSLEQLEISEVPVSLLQFEPANLHWLFLGCGTSFYLAEAAAASFRSILRASASAYPASEFLLYPESVLVEQGKQIFPVLISRSGMTSEVIRAARGLRERQRPFLAITCDGGELEQLTPYTLRLPVPEQSTVMTASFTSMLQALQFTAAAFSGNESVKADLAKIPPVMEKFLQENEGTLKKLADQPFENYVFLGQGVLFGIAQECALKVTESSCSYTQSYHTLEFRHGPKSIVAPQVLTSFLLSETGYEEELEVLREMKELGATTLAICNEATPALRQFADYVFELKLPVPEILRASAYTVVGQLLGSYIGLRKGLNPDTPKNLTRVVMLEA